MKTKVRYYRIRKNGWNNLFLNKNGEWVEWRKASKFKDQDRADAHAAKFGINDHGLFDTRPSFGD